MYPLFWFEKKCVDNGDICNIARFSTLLQRLMSLLFVDNCVIVENNIYPGRTVTSVLRVHIVRWKTIFVFCHQQSAVLIRFQSTSKFTISFSSFSFPEVLYHPNDVIVGKEPHLRRWLVAQPSSEGLLRAPINANCPHIFSVWVLLHCG